MEHKITIRFMANVDHQSVKALIDTVTSELSKGNNNFRILISSPGGYVDPGLSAFNFLRGIPAKIETVNFGSVDSISTVLFCAGTQRISVPNARFLIHDIFRITPQQPVNLSETQLIEWLEGLRIDRKNIAKVIAQTCKKPVEEIESVMKGGKIFNPIEAQRFGLVTEIKQEFLQKGEAVITL